MKITKQSFGYVLETGKSVTTFNRALIEDSRIADIHLYYNRQDRTTIPNQHIKEFEQKFIEAGGVIE